MNANVVLPGRRLFIIALVFLLSYNVSGFASVPAPTIDELAKGSDLIVLAKVESVQGLPLFGNRTAKAKIIENWKGPAVETVEFLVVGTDQSPCDISDARRGETVLLFLSKRNQTWVIDWSGRGRMPIVKQDDKDYATFFAALFPDKSSVIDMRTKGLRGFDQGVELDTVRALVERSLKKN